MNFRNVAILSIPCFILVACSSGPQRHSKIDGQDPLTDRVEVVQDSLYHLDQARLNFGQNHDFFPRNDSLLAAAAALQQEQQCPKSIKMLKVLQGDLQDSRQLTLANVLQAECYLMLSVDYLGLAQQHLQEISFDYGYGPRIAAVQGKIYAHQQRWLLAAQALQQSSIAVKQQSPLIWDWLQNLDLAQLEQALQQAPELKAWIQLTTIVQRFALAPQHFISHVARWEEAHQGHILQIDLPIEIQQLLILPPISPRKIAILLPLTGRLASRGLALKQGFLAAYLNKLPKDNSLDNFNLVFEHSGQGPQQIRFFDSALKTPKELNDLVIDFDLVVGPLVKEKIVGLSKILPADKILLALNRVELGQTIASIEPTALLLEPQPTKEHYYFSLAPEDEARQLAQYVQEKQLGKPIIFVADNDTTKRMAEAFIAHWRQTPGTQIPTMTIFKDSKDMRRRVSQMLDVAQSKARIRQIERISNAEVFGVERNRRDIDAIVLFASPQQTELLNPIIEASLSPFARKSLSVFASSRSYSSDLSNNSLRDLRNLTFSDMPWMLPAHDWQDLSALVSDLWPQKQDSLLRLFAMGYDAYNLLGQLRALTLLPNISSPGLTGNISIDTQGVLHRRLPWAKVAQDRVMRLAMD